jgi:hypothetical protein
MESNHPSEGLLRPAGFEDRMGVSLVQRECDPLNGLENRYGEDVTAEIAAWNAIRHRCCAARRVHPAPRVARGERRWFVAENPVRS